MKTHEGKGGYRAQVVWEDVYGVIGYRARVVVARLMSGECKFSVETMIGTDIMGEELWLPYHEGSPVIEALAKAIVITNGNLPDWAR